MRYFALVALIVLLGCAQHRDMPSASINSAPQAQQK
jgi:hypothetical protein